MSDMAEDRIAFLTELKDDLAKQTPGALPMQELLERILEGVEAPIGTIHGVEPSGNLILLASRGLDDELKKRVEHIPPGKGLAGLAAQRLAPVDLCNLQTDTSGQAKPAAKQTGAAASIAIPMLVDGKLRGVLGIALSESHEFNDDEKKFLLDLASVTGSVVG